MSSHCTKTCDPCVRKGNPDQEQISRSGQETTLKVEVKHSDNLSSKHSDNLSATFVWQVSRDSGCNYQVIPDANGPTYTFIPSQEDDGNLYKIIITEQSDDKKSSHQSYHKKGSRNKRSIQTILLSIETSWVNHTVYVDSKFGSDLTGQVENLLLPFQTIEAAIQAILCSKFPPSSKDRWCIKVRCGDYPINSDLWLPGFVSITGSGIEDTILHVSSFVGFNGTLNSHPESGPVIENLTVEGCNQPVVQTTGGEQPDNGNRAHGITLRTNRVIRTDNPGVKFNQLIWRPDTPGQLAFNTATLAGDNTPIDIEANSQIIYNTGSTNYGFQNVSVVGDMAGSNVTDSTVSLDLDAPTNDQGQVIGNGAQANMAVLVLLDPPKSKVMKIKNVQGIIKARQVSNPIRIKYAGAIMTHGINIKSDQLTVSTATREANIDTYFTGIAVGDDNTLVEVNSDYTANYFDVDIPPEVFGWGAYDNAEVSSNYTTWSVDFIPEKFTDNILATTGTVPSDNNTSIDADENADLSVDGEITSNGGVNIQGGLCGRVRTVSTDTTLTADDYILLANPGAGSITVTLPSPPGCAGKTYYVKNITTMGGTVDLAAPPGGLIDDAATKTLNQFDSIEVASNDAASDQWWVIANFINA